MKRDELMKMGLDEETAAKVDAAAAEWMKEELKGHVPYDRFRETIEERNKARETVKERDGQIDALKNSAGDMDELRKQIGELQAANVEKDEKHAAELYGLRVSAAVDAALAGAKARNNKAVLALLELDKAELAEDGTVKGLDEQLKRLAEAEDSKFLFDSENKKLSMKGAKPAESGRDNPTADVDVSKMTYEEIAAYLEENPDARI